MDISAIVARGLVVADQICDYIPVLSSLSNAIVLLFQKCVCPRLSQETRETHHYWKHISNKNEFRCKLLLIPVLGNLCAIIFDLGGSGDKSTASQPPLRSNLAPLRSNLGTGMNIVAPADRPMPKRSHSVCLKPERGSCVQNFTKLFSLEPPGRTPIEILIQDNPFARPNDDKITYIMTLKWNEKHEPIVSPTSSRSIQSGTNDRSLSITPMLDYAHLVSYRPEDSFHLEFQCRQDNPEYIQLNITSRRSTEGSDQSQVLQSYFIHGPSQSAFLGMPTPASLFPQRIQEATVAFPDREIVAIEPRSDTTVAINLSNATAFVSIPTPQALKHLDERQARSAEIVLHPENRRFSTPQECTLLLNTTERYLCIPYPCNVTLRYVEHSPLEVLINQIPAQLHPSSGTSDAEWLTTLDSILLSHSFQIPMPVLQMVHDYSDPNRIPFLREIASMLQKGNFIEWLDSRITARVTALMDERRKAAPIQG